MDDTAEITEALQELSAGTDTQIATFDVKHQYDYLDRSSTEQYFDVLIAAYLLNPLKNDYDMEAIASEHLGILIPGRAHPCSHQTGSAQVYSLTPVMKNPP